LRIVGCFKVNDQGLINSIVHCPQLQVVDLYSCWDVTTKGIECIAANCHDLISIDLTSCRKVSDEGILVLLKECKQLQNLFLAYCKVLTDNLFSTPKLFASIRRLNLQRCTLIRDEAFRRIATGGPNGSAFKLASLQELVLTDCSFLSNEAIKFISECCPNLEVLSLSFCCAITEVSIKSITLCKRLISLDLSFCGSAVSDVTLGVLGTELVKLEELNIRGCVRGNTFVLHFSPSQL
jgi:F-box/leucine-rich repeat protein 7